MILLKLTFRYFQSGSEMLKMANSYYNDGDDEKAYIFYFRYTILFAVKVCTVLRA